MSDVNEKTEQSTNEVPKSSDERMWAMFCHLSALSGFVIPFGNVIARSEERRVGKECRSRWSPYH